MKVWVESDDGSTELISDAAEVGLTKVRPSDVMKEHEEKNATTGLIIIGTLIAAVGTFIQFGFALSLIALGVGFIITGVKR